MNLVLNDGTVLENARAGYAEGFLWLYIRDFTMQEAAALFFDPAKAGKIVFNYGEMQDVYEGFTDCIRLLVDVDKTVSVCMRKGS